MGIHVDHGFAPSIGPSSVANSTSVAKELAPRTMKDVLIRPQRADENLGKRLVYGKHTRNIGETYGKHMGNIWETYGGFLKWDYPHPFIDGERMVVETKSGPKSWEIGSAHGETDEMMNTRGVGG